MNPLSIVMKVTSIKKRISIITNAYHCLFAYRSLLKPHLKTARVASVIALLLYTHRAMNFQVMVSLSRAAGASIAAIQSLLYKLILSKFIEVTYAFGELKDLLPKVRETMLLTKKQMKGNYAKKSHFLNDLNLGIEIGGEKSPYRFYK